VLHHQLLVDGEGGPFEVVSENKRNHYLSLSPAECSVETHRAYSSWHDHEEAPVGGFLFSSSGGAHKDCDVDLRPEESSSETAAPRAMRCLIAL